MINGAKENVLYDKAYAFAIRIVKAYEFLNDTSKLYPIAKQLLRSGTAVGANVSEANGAISKAEFSAKLSLAYKECLETKYWLSLLKDTAYIDDMSYESIAKDADEIAKIIYAVLKKTRIAETK